MMSLFGTLCLWDTELVKFGLITVPVMRVFCQNAPFKRHQQCNKAGEKLGSSMSSNILWDLKVSLGWLGRVDDHGLWKWCDVIIFSPSEIRHQANWMGVCRLKVLTLKNLRVFLVIRPLGMETGNARTVSKATITWKWASLVSGLFATDYRKHENFERQRWTGIVYIVGQGCQGELQWFEGLNANLKGRTGEY